MGTNFFRDGDLKKKENRLLSVIKQKMTYDIEHEKIFVVVEGDDDEAFFDDKFLSKVEVIQQNNNGKPGVLAAIRTCDNPPRGLEMLGQNKNRVIGICDHDYDESAENGRIFYYDFCNLEMMLIFSDEVMRQITEKFYRSTHGELTPEEVRLKILCELKWISLLHKKKLNLKLAKKPHFLFLEVVDEQFHFHVEQAIQKILGRNLSMDRSKLEAHFNEVSNECGELPDDLQLLLKITRGHDFVWAFKRFCTDESRNIKPEEKEIMSALIEFYSLLDFQQTQLYSALQAYERSTNLSILSA